MKSISIGMTAKRVATLLFESGAIIFRTSRPFKFTSGILSPVYSDNRLLISDVAKREEIEDFFSTGQSSALAVKALRKLGVNADNLLAIFTYDLADSKENFKKNKINLIVLCNLETAANVAEENGYLKKEHVKTILEWAKDPKNWAKKMGFA